MKKSDREMIEDMISAAREAMQFVEGRDREDLDKDMKLRRAVERCLEILGEAAGDVSGDLKGDNGHIQWREIIATRNRLIHEYGSVDLDLVWQTVKNALPKLVEKLEAILAAQ